MVTGISGSSFSKQSRLETGEVLDRQTVDGVSWRDKINRCKKDI